MEILIHEPNEKMKTGIFQINGNIIILVRGTTIAAFNNGSIEAEELKNWFQRKEQEVEEYADLRENEGFEIGTSEGFHEGYEAGYEDGKGADLS